VLKISQELQFWITFLFESTSTDNMKLLSKTMILCILTAINAFAFTAYRTNQFRIAMTMTESPPEAKSELAPKSERGPAIFIGNIPFDITEDTIKAQVTQKIGSTFSNVFLVKDKVTGNSRGFAYVNFEANQEAELPNKLASLSGLEINGNALKVELFEKKAFKQRVGDDGTGKKTLTPRNKEKRVYMEEMSAYVGNLAYTVTSDELKSFLTSFVDPASIKSVRLAVNKETGACRGFGHVEFTSKENCQDAISKLNGQEFAGRVIRANSADSKEEQEKAASLSREANQIKSANAVYLGNLAWSVDEEIIQEMLTDVVGPSTFTTVRLARDRQTNRTRGFAHVEFVDVATCERAIEALNGLEVMGRSILAAKAAKAESN